MIQQTTAIVYLMFSTPNDNMNGGDSRMRQRLFWFSKRPDRLLVSLSLVLSGAEEYYLCAQLPRPDTDYSHPLPRLRRRETIFPPPTGIKGVYKANFSFLTVSPPFQNMYGFAEEVIQGGVHCIQHEYQ